MAPPPRPRKLAPDRAAPAACPDLALRLLKRQHAMQHFKETPCYRFVRATAERDPTVVLPEEPLVGLGRSKRAWEHLMGCWKEALSELCAVEHMRAVGETYEPLPAGPRHPDPREVPWPAGLLGAQPGAGQA